VNLSAAKKTTVTCHPKSTFGSEPALPHSPFVRHTSLVPRRKRPAGGTFECSLRAPAPDLRHFESALKWCHFYRRGGPVGANGRRCRPPPPLQVGKTGGEGLQTNRTTPQRGENSLDEKTIGPVILGGGRRSALCCCTVSSVLVIPRLLYLASTGTLEQWTDSPASLYYYTLPGRFFCLEVEGILSSHCAPEIRPGLIELWLLVALFNPLRASRAIGQRVARAARLLAPRRKDSPLLRRASSQSHHRPHYSCSGADNRRQRSIYAALQRRNRL